MNWSNDMPGYGYGVNEKDNLTQTPARSLLLVLIIVLIPLVGTGAELELDYRYAPSKWYTPIGFVDDWQKTLVNPDGEFHYDFGPGPYVRPNTRVAIGMKGEDFQMTDQFIEDARVPIVETVAGNQDGQMHLKAFALVREANVTEWAKQESQTRIHRLQGLTGSVGWASPPGDVDPAFRNVAWGTNRPIIYRLDVEKGSAKKVALGFCESYRHKPDLRVAAMQVEGAPNRTVDLATATKKNQPQVYTFDARDENGDGQLELEVHAAPTSKGPNTILNVVWVFPADQDLPREELISGDLNPNAEIYVDCGLEPQVIDRSPRVDAVLARFTGQEPQPVITVTSTRRLEYSKTDTLLTIDGKPFVVSDPAPAEVRKTENGWELLLPENTRQAEITVIRGYQLPEEITRVPDLEREISIARDHWRNETDIPWGTIQVGDPELQSLIVSSIRTVYQSREVVDGYPQFQPGMSLYRGLWVHDATYLIDTAALLGDISGARRALEGLLRHQKPSGQLHVMEPITMHRETSLMVWLMCRFARLSGDYEWLRSHWTELSDGVEYMQTLRQRTLSSPEAPYYGLVPPGFTDGGIGGENAEYSTVYWMLISLEEAIDMAKKMGKPDQADRWKEFYQRLLESFHQAARRDIQHDDHGNPYLPVRVADTTDIQYPQRAQWSLCEALQFGDFLQPGDSLVQGTLAMLDTKNVQGLVHSTGWLDEGIWAYFGSFYGMAHLWSGNVEKAQEVLYAFANHASPTGTWVEEQMPEGMGNRTAGDRPHAWASAMMARFVRYMLAAERANELQLLPGAPGQWYTTAGSRLKDAPTLYGELSFDQKIYPTQRGGYVTVHPLGNETAVQLSLQELQRAGYGNIDGEPFPESVEFSREGGGSILFRVLPE